MATPDELGLTGEIIREAALNVARRMHGPSVEVDLNHEEEWFRRMVSEVAALGNAAASTGLEYGGDTKQEGKP